MKKIEKYRDVVSMLEKYREKVAILEKCENFKRNREKTVKIRKYV